MDQPSSDFKNIAAVNRRTGTMMSVRLRGDGITSKANTLWHIIEDDEDAENDVVMGDFKRSPIPTTIIPSAASAMNSAASLPRITAFQSGIMKPNGISIKTRKLSRPPPDFIRRSPPSAKHLYPKMNRTFSNPSSNPSSSISRRSQPSTKYSYKLRNMLQTDLKMSGSPSNGSQQTLSLTRSTFSRPVRRVSRTVPIPNSSSQTLKTHTSHNTANSSQASLGRNGVRSLNDEFSQDIQTLLKSLHSSEFQGTIDPLFHASYVSQGSSVVSQGSEQSFMQRS